MAACSSILAWSIPWTEEPGRLWSMVSQKRQTRLSDALTVMSTLALWREVKMLMSRQCFDVKLIP